MPVCPEFAGSRRTSDPRRLRLVPCRRGTRREDLSAQQLKRQQALDRSWREAEQGLADPEFRAYIEASLRRLDEESSSTPLVTRGQFLAQTR